MKSVAKLFGGSFFMAWLVASFALFFSYWDVLTNWLGGVLGTVVALFAAPGVLCFSTHLLGRPRSISTLLL
jgi:hypothetical protein